MSTSGKFSDVLFILDKGVRGGTTGRRFDGIRVGLSGNSHFWPGRTHCDASARFVWKAPAGFAKSQTSISALADWFSGLDYGRHKQIISPISGVPFTLAIVGPRKSLKIEKG